ncbi:cytochrome P450 [Beijerinckia sp. L45]|uniref:cytochrome P450 n=1 Tax=Beijerinckia sp. L45 TaxID=1641855 RepID=UPI001FED531C|nr:cytochrome P450 [Beijerinckia sp. L45]
MLRRGGTRQAGFNAALVERFPQKNLSVLFKEGDAHRLQRSAVARFFAPKVVSERYRRLMTDLSVRLVARFKTRRRARLDDMSLTLSVAVAAEIVGVTESVLPGLGWRLNRFFALEAPSLDARFSTAAYIVRAQVNLLAVYLLDVRPAIRARRRDRREDLISHLIDQGWSDLDILTECVTYATAGMSTTREFIIVAAWHLLERGDLRRRFLESDETGRCVILEEILRLEPPVGTIFRRTNVAVTLDDDGRKTDIPADTVVAIDIRGVNADEGVVGGCPHRLDPDRAKRGPSGHMSFGDGAHKCPGASVALQETSIFLDHLLRVPGVTLASAPKLSWNTMTMGYVLRRVILTAE